MQGLLLKIGGFFFVAQFSKYNDEVNCALP
jgi:hypothetical protein